MYPQAMRSGYYYDFTMSCCSDVCPDVQCQQGLARPARVHCIHAAAEASYDHERSLALLFFKISKIH